MSSTIIFIAFFGVFASCVVLGIIYSCVRNFQNSSSYNRARDEAAAHPGLAPAVLRRSPSSRRRRHSSTRGNRFVSTSGRFASNFGSIGEGGFAGAGYDQKVSDGVYHQHQQPSSKALEFTIPAPAPPAYQSAGPASQFGPDGVLPVMDDVDLRNRMMWVTVTVLRAVGLRGVDRNGLSDPSACIEDDAVKVRESAVVEKTIDPNWAETAAGPVSARLFSNGLGTVGCSVWDHNKLLPRRLLGRVAVDKHGLVMDQCTEDWYPLKGSVKEEEKWSRLGEGGPALGEVMMRLECEAMTVQECVDMTMSQVRAGKHNNVFVNLLPGSSQIAMAAVNSATLSAHLPITGSGNYSITTERTHSYRRTRGSGNHRRTYYVYKTWYGSFMLHSDGSGDLLARISYENREGNSDFVNDFAVWTSSVLQALLNADCLVRDPRQFSVTSAADGFAAQPGCVIL